MAHTLMGVPRPNPRPSSVKELKVCLLYITSSSSYSSTSQWYAKVISFLFQNSKKNTAMGQKKVQVSKTSADKIALVKLYINKDFTTIFKISKQ